MTKRGATQTNVASRRPEPSNWRRTSSARLWALTTDFFPGFPSSPSCARARARRSWGSGLASTLHGRFRSQSSRVAASTTAARPLASSGARSKTASKGTMSADESSRYQREKCDGSSSVRPVTSASAVASSRPSNWLFGP